MRRVVVIGASGAGKTTLAGHLAESAGVPHIDFDPLFWQPGWVPVDRDILRRRVRDATEAPAWIASGNYFDSAGPVAWESADTVVWLDLPRRVTFPRLIRRVIRQARTQEELWPGCRQRWTTAFRTGLFVYAFRQTGVLRRRTPPLIPGWRASGIRVIRLRSPEAIRSFLRSNA